MPRKTETDPTRTASLLIDRHGLRAAAVAAEYASEAQIAGDPAALHRWRQVQSALVELRSAERGTRQHTAAFSA